VESLIGLVPDDILELNKTKYKLLDIAGEGGSSIVYLARPVGGTSGSYVMIKEFFPPKLGITRAKRGKDAGAITVPPGNQEIFLRIIKRVAQEPDIAKALRNDRAYAQASGEGSKPGQTNSPWFLECSEPIESKGTSYTIIETKSGQTLKSLISSGFFKEKSFMYICGCMMKILDALEHVHQKGYLHLDIAPDNIFVPEYKKGFAEITHVHLIDYNSALKKGTTPDDWISSYKEGYSAAELDRLNKKPADLDEAADTYSVAAILFELLVCRKLRRTDRGSFSSWKLTANSNALKGASDLLVKAANSFLLTGIEKAAGCRFQNVAEMREALANLINLSTRKTLRFGKLPAPAYGRFVGMTAYLEQIDMALGKSNYIYIEGIGGTGKTELAKKYAEIHRRKFDIIQLITYDGSLMSTIAHQLKFHGYDEDIYAAKYKAACKNAAVNDNAADLKVAEKIFEDKLRFLDEHKERILIIVDNYDVLYDDRLNQFVSGNYKVMFTSRAEHNANAVVVDGMADEGEALALFCEYYRPRKATPEEAPAIHEIGKWANRHTMTIELAAAALSTNDDTIENMLKRLKGGIAGIGAYAEIDKQGLGAMEREQTISMHIKNLFCMPEILKNEDYVYILTNMAILPNDGLWRGDYYDWALSERYRGEKDEADRDLASLKKLRLAQLRFDEETGKQKLSLHALVSEITNAELKPDSVKCKPLITGLVAYARECESKTYIEQNECASIMESACRRIKDETETTANLYACTAKLFSALARYEKSLELYLKALDIRETLPGPKHKYTASIYDGIAGVFDSMGNVGEALEWYEKASSAYESMTDADPLDVAANYNNTALAYFNQGGYFMAMVLYKKALTICEGELGDEHEITATTYNNLAGVFDRMGDYSGAIALYSMALAIRKKTLGDYHPQTANTYNNIAGTYSRLGDYAKSLELYGAALDIREKVLGLEHPSTAATYNNMASIHNRLGDYDKAFELFSKDLDITKKAYGMKHPATATSYNNIAGVYYNNRDFRKALELYGIALEIRKDALGPDHPDTATTYNNMALVYTSLGDYGKALELLAKDLAISIKTLGPEHPAVATNYSNVALTYYESGNYESALEWFEKSLAIREKTLGTGHPDTTATYNYIASAKEILRPR